MKPPKLLVLAVAALTVMASVGASSAVAETTALCAADESPCASGNQISHVHETTLSGSPAVLLNSVGNVLCSALFLGDTSGGNSGSPLVIKGNFTYTGCVRHKSGGGTENCTITEKNGPAEVKVLKEGHETAKVTGEGEVNVKCGFFINCTYNGEGLEATAKGPLLSSETNGSVLLDNAVTHKVSGTFCPSTAELDITTTPLSATYITTIGSTALCTADESTCETEHQISHVHETTLAGSPAVLLNSVGNVLCEVLFLGEALLNGEKEFITLVEDPDPKNPTALVISGNFTYSSCVRHKSGGGTENCTVTEKNGPAEVKVLKEGHETAKVTGEGEVNVKCSFFINCTYNGEGLEGTAKGPLLSSETNGSVLLDNAVTHKVSGTFCPSTAELDITTTPLEATYISS